MATGYGDMNTSAVVEMADGDDSDYEVNFTDVQRNDPSPPPSQRGTGDDMKAEVAKNVTSYMFEAGKQKARQVFDVYGKIDILRPYFDVEPHIVRARLLASLVPKKPSAERVQVPRELYGPTMLILTLIALLLFQMKLADHAVQEGTLMGTAFGTCFGYWLGISSLVWVLAYVCNTHITMLQILSLLGYALFGHCIVLFLGTVIHTTHDHMFFYFLWALFGGLSTLKMVSVLASRTAGNSQKLVVCGAVAAFHLLFLLYLHFAYHQVVEDLSDLIQDAGKQVYEAQKPGLPDVADKIVDGKEEAVAAAVVGNGDMGGEDMAQAVKSVTKAAVQRIIREVRPANETIAKPLANALANNGSKILQAIAPQAKHLNQTLLESGRQIIHQASNSSVVLKL